MFPAAAIHSFAQLASIPLDQPCELHPQACNPTMDLVALLLPAGQSIKGKGRAGEGRTKVQLWRMISGAKVWEVDLDGVAEGLAWSRDGLHLSLVVLRYPSLPSSFLQPSEHWHPAAITLEHLSVHSGEVVRSVPLSIPERLERGRWSLEWTSEGAGWTQPRNGSSLYLIDSLPRPSVVDPPKHPNMLPFALPTVTTSKVPTLHSKLAQLPSLLPREYLVESDVLLISPPGSSTQERLLTGTFPLPASTPQYISLALIFDRLSRYLDTVLRGLEAAEHALREANRQTAIWREDLEACAEQQGMARDQVHADLFRLLMTGRSDVAVSDWLGKNLTARTIAKWEQVLDTAYATIGRTMRESVCPAIEYIILLLEDLQGWTEPIVNLDNSAIDAALTSSAVLAAHCDNMRQEANHAAYCAAEFMKWLRYEIARTTAGDQSSDMAPIFMHDLKYTWAFMWNALVASPFPSRASSSFSNSILDAPQSVMTYLTSLEMAVGETMARLERSAPRNDFSSPPLASVSFENSISVELASPHGGASAPGTPGRPTPKGYVSEMPSTWADGLVHKCVKIVSETLRGATQQASNGCCGPFFDQRRIDKTTWTAQATPESLLLCATPDQGTPTSVVFPLHISCLSVQFFDDVELALLLQDNENLYLAMIEYNTEQASDGGLPVTRFRCLPSALEDSKPAMALNGRAGRRVGCIATSDSIEVLDMDGSEDDELDMSDA